MGNKTSLLLTLIGFSFLVTSCGGDSSPGPEAPLNAIVINSSNATEVATTAVLYTDVGYALVAADVTSVPVKQAFDTVIAIAFDRNRQSSNIATGVLSSDPCSGGGSTSFDSTSSYDVNTDETTTEGVLSFNSCSEFGMTINGNFSTSSIFNEGTSDYDDNGNGSITISINGLSFTMAMNYAQTGNTIDTSFVSEISFSIASPQFEGFLVETSVPLVGISGLITSGQLIVTGSANTRLRLTFNPDTTITVELDDGSGYQFHTYL